MDFIVELIVGLLTDVVGEALTSPRVPKIIRTVLTCILLVPFVVLCAALAVNAAFRHEAAFCLLLCGAAAVLIALGFVLIRKIWKKA